MASNVAWCHRCGLQVDETVKQVYPWYEEDGLIDVPMPVLIKVWVEALKTARICHACFHDIQPDKTGS